MLRKSLGIILSAVMIIGCLNGCGNTSTTETTTSAAAKATTAVTTAVAAKDTNTTAAKASTAPAATTAGSSATKEKTSINCVDLSGKDIYVGVAPGSGGSAWRDQMLNDITGVLDEYKQSGNIKDYKVVNNTTNGDANEEAQIIRNFIDDPDINVILVNPNDTTSLNEAIQDAEDAGKLVVVYDASVTAEGVLNVSVDHYKYAYGPTKTLCDIIGGKGSVVEISGLDGHPANVIRIKATDDALAEYPNIKLLQNTPGGWDNTTTKTVTAAILASGAKPDGIISQDNGCLGVLEACIDANYIPKVVSGDGSKPFFEEWKKLKDEGHDFNSVVVPNPPGIGATAARIAIKMAKGRHLDESNLDGNTFKYTVTTVYTNDNFEDGWNVVKDFTDQQCIDEFMTDKDAEKLFKD